MRHKKALWCRCYINTQNWITFRFLCGTKWAKSNPAHSSQIPISNGYCHNYFIVFNSIRLDSLEKKKIFSFLLHINMSLRLLQKLSVRTYELMIIQYWPEFSFKLSNDNAANGWVRLCTDDVKFNTVKASSEASWRDPKMTNWAFFYSALRVVGRAAVFALSK